jgi:hypothetical protein
MWCVDILICLVNIVTIGILNVDIEIQFQINILEEF